HEEDPELPSDRDEINEAVAFRKVAYFRRGGWHGVEMPGDGVLLRWSHRVQAREHFDRVPLKLHELPALDLNDLAFCDAGRTQHVGMRFGADDLRAGLLRDVWNVPHVIPVAMTDENLVGLTNALIDDGLLDFESGTRVEFPREEPGVETTEPWIEENGLVSERDLPPVGPEPRPLDPSRPRPPPPRPLLRA